MADQETSPSRGLHSRNERRRRSLNKRYQAKWRNVAGAALAKARTIWIELGARGKFNAGRTGRFMMVKN